MKKFFFKLTLSRIIHLVAVFFLVSTVKSGFSSTNLAPPRPENKKSPIPQSCLDALSIKSKVSELKWTLRPGKGSKGNVRFIYQTILSGKGGAQLSIEKKSVPQKTLYLSLKTLKQIEFYKLNPSTPKKCHVTLLRKEKKTRENSHYKLTGFKTKTSDFTDDDLKMLLKESKKGIIYLWSPHMPYSVGSLYPLQNAAKKLKLPLTILMDPLANDKEIKKVTKQFSLPSKLTRRNKAERLHLQGASLHFPNYFFYKEGKISHVQLFGATGEEAIHEALEKAASK